MYLSSHPVLQVFAMLINGQEQKVIFITMSHLPGVLFFWKDPERPIDMILLQSDQSKSFGKEEHLCYCSLTPQLIIKTYQQQKFIHTVNISMYLIEWLVFENRFSLNNSQCTLCLVLTKVLSSLTSEIL
ncbi:hypothetical protein PHYBLDRAFT_168362 [Phycomyces blakesleeanus NRRL 1555(-)]|uniref:Uncharacterized protein n=1 Tax=Phycomyces blakesleeanus (strain ATCC 8743b / DSM 1359 / FGSC 10004 / NBRC 33097 / NRRL 1555) TaxID=763407 RepID=A0A167MTN3_PHYB8|nr:hypothetical protein PHYBLDRAFT_168362 [Phycomyces blakesleeanus NRRL 1555(-)]OAD73939.1 hypothetical protein PHYBLDRAFT_168362 [Phycomyces blakesleeanus NRRL 1555(-)]|eukprot:XP_018291979.1 hypothetical protein PHYBLDRAFT_168362 [Phycomyces blakesleeanus NRRL 1555(-)]